MVETPVLSQQSPESQNIAMSEVEEAFLTAIRRGDVGVVRQLIEQGYASANMIVTLTADEIYQHMTDDRVSMSALHAATTFGAVDVIELLLEKQAYINSTAGAYGETPLMVALELSFFHVADILLKHGADTNISNSHISSSSPLQFCCCATRAHYIPTLLRYGACIQGSKNASETPLHKACWNGDLQSASILVEHGADVHARDIHDRSPIFAVTNNLDIMRMLIAHGAQVNLQDNNGWTPLHYVGNNPCCELLLSSNASIDVQNCHGVTPLHIAVDYDRFDVVGVLLAHQRSRHGQDGVCSLLLKTEHGRYNQNVLHYASTVETARLLVEQCQCEDGILLAACHQLMLAEDYGGKTPLNRARRSSHADVMEYLESFSMLTLATDTAACPDDSVAVMLNPRLDDFQQAIATGCLDLIRSSCLDVPDATLYGMMGYLSPLDVMKR